MTNHVRSFAQVDRSRSFIRFEFRLNLPYTSPCFYSRVPFSDVSCPASEEDAVLKALVEHRARDGVDCPRGSIVVWNTSTLALEKFAQTPLAGWIQSRETGTVHRVSNDYGQISSVRVAHKFVLDRLLVLCVDEQLPVLDFGNYRMHYNQVFDRLLAPKEARACVRVRHTDFMHDVVPLLISPSGQRIASAFYVKDFTGTELDIRSLRFEHPRAIAYQMKTPSMPSGDSFHLRVEVQKDDQCIAYAMVPLRMSNSIHTHEKKEIRREDSIAVDDLHRLIDGSLFAPGEGTRAAIPMPDACGNVDGVVG